MVEEEDDSDYTSDDSEAETRSMKTPHSCPCCDALKGATCGCFEGEDEHQLQPPTAGLNFLVPNDTNRCCCGCLEDLWKRPLMLCYTCECAFCEDCVFDGNIPSNKARQAAPLLVHSPENCERFGLRVDCSIVGTVVIPRKRRKKMRDIGSLLSSALLRLRSDKGIFPPEESSLSSHRKPTQWVDGSGRWVESSRYAVTS